jgi:CHAT domain-containing protein/tetratricopeptide (TPR) repeat protein
MMRAASPSPATYPRAGQSTRWVAVVIGLVVAGAAFWWIVTWSARQLKNAEALLAEGSQRTFDYRLPGAPYAQVHPEEHKRPAFAKPVPLLEAESLVARRLVRDPDSAPWLRLRARLEMLDLEPETAIATLQHALEQKPDDPDLLADLGVAYALRADTQNRDVDFAYAIEYLSRSLKAKPNSAVAVFNRAIIYERTYLYGPAEGEWRHFLEMETSGTWRAEAQLRLANLEQKLAARQTALTRTSDKDPDSLLRRLAAGQEVEPEEYLDMVVIEWLPRRSQNDKYERALRALAVRFEEQHGDLWLHDVLASKPGKRLTQGLVTLSEAVQANLATESDRALAESAEAADQLRAAGNAAAVLRAEFEQIYALDQARVSVADCVTKGSAREREAVARSYYWIAGQALLEQGNCDSVIGDFAAARSAYERSLEYSRLAAYPDLELRAAGILAEMQTLAGNLLAAWGVGRMGLAKYWDGSHSGVRAFQIYFDSMRSTEGLGLLQAAYVFGSAAAMAIAETERRRSEATIRAYLADLAVKAGWSARASDEFGQASSLFDQLKDSGLESRTAAELYRAQAEIAGGELQRALWRLEAIRRSAETVPSATVRINYEQALADSLRLNGRPGEAEAAYGRTLGWIEDQLNTLRGFRDRAQLVQLAGKAYRGLLGLLWERGDVTRAWRLWERFRAAERQEEGGEAGLEERRARLRSESFLSYAMLPGAVVAWVFDDRGVEGRRLVVKPEDLEKVSLRFLRECSDPTSDQHSLRRDARLLYDWLLAPVVSRLDSSKVLVVEPDGAVGTIPMQALIDPNSRYFGEKFATTVATGLVDYQARASVGPVVADSKALVIADPRLGASMAKAFPVLPEALREAQSIAARFPASVLLSGEQATLAALERQRPDTELLHFSGHGFSNAGNGGLLLSPRNDSTEEAGILDGNALAQQDWTRCRLAVLSACSTGTGETRGPVNPESLVRSLLWAGVARVVASRWNSDSETGVQFMDRFYTSLLGGKDVAVALQAASKELRENEATSHPFYWAAFQSFGTR